MFFWNYLAFLMIQQVLAIWFISILIICLFVNYWANFESTKNIQVYLSTSSQHIIMLWVKPFIMHLSLCDFFPFQDTKFPYTPSFHSEELWYAKLNSDSDCRQSILISWFFKLILSYLTGLWCREGRKAHFFEAGNEEIFQCLERK